jgi:hypothetical protein
MLVTDILPARVINRLVTSHIARFSEYASLAENCPVAVFRSLFRDAAETSAACSQELMGELFKMGAADVPVETGEHTHAFGFIRDAGARNDQRMLLNAVFVEGEVMRDLYFQGLVIENEAITTQHHLVFLRHYALIKEWQDKVRNLLALMCDNLN